jgi:hypothetical protein
MNEVCLALDAIDSRMEARDNLDAERRRTDDSRFQAAEAGRDDILTRTATTAQRTAKLEATWEAFFGERGAFPLVMETIKGHSKKIDRLTWLVAVGVGILITLQCLIGLKH